MFARSERRFGHRVSRSWCRRGLTSDGRAGAKQELQKRLGFFNLFREEMAVDYWVLDLADVEQARVLQELIFLGDEEPGRNFVEVMFNDKDFQVPAGWLKQVARAGIISLHYCREKDTCRRIEASFSGQWPPMYHERHGLEWVARQRLKTIKEKVVLSSSSSSLITP